MLLTQSRLECMQERQITVDLETRPARPFLSWRLRTQLSWKAHSPSGGPARLVSASGQTGWTSRRKRRSSPVSPVEPAGDAGECGRSRKVLNFRKIREVDVEIPAPVHDCSGPGTRTMKISWARAPAPRWALLALYPGGDPGTEFVIPDDVKALAAPSSPTASW
jgi:hypothetical protein